jgi:hypothetical protein
MRRDKPLEGPLQSTLQDLTQETNRLRGLLQKFRSFSRPMDFNLDSVDLGPTEVAEPPQPRAESRRLQTSPSKKRATAPRAAFRMNYPAASCGVSKITESRQNILSRQDAKSAKKNMTLFLRTWRALRLCASHLLAEGSMFMGCVLVADQSFCCRIATLRCIAFRRRASPASCARLRQWRPPLRSIR